MYIYYLLLFVNVIYSIDIFDNQRDAFFVTMRTEKYSKHAPVELASMKPAYRNFVINTDDENTVCLTQEFVDKCKLFSRVEKEKMDKQSIDLPISQECLNLCASLANNMKTLSPSLKELQQVYWAYNYLDVPIELQDQILERVIRTLSHKNQLLELDEYISARLQKRKKVIFNAQFVSGYCRKHFRFFRNDANIIYERLMLMPRFSLDLSKNNQMEFKPVANMQWTFVWNKKDRLLNISLISDRYGKIFEGSLSNKNGEILIAGPIQNALCIVVYYTNYKQHKFCKSLYVDYQAPYQMIKRMIESKKQVYDYLEFKNNIVDCNLHIQKKYKEIKVHKFDRNDLDIFA